MNSLVDYGSDSDDDFATSTTPSNVVTAPPTKHTLNASSSSSSFLNLPPPKSTPTTTNPTKSTTIKKLPLPPPPKKAKAPVRILLDLPPPSTSSTSSTSIGSDEEGRATKKPKLSLGSGSSGGGGGGLAALLPKPKNEAPPAKARGGGSGGFLGTLPPPSSSSTTTTTTTSRVGSAGEGATLVPNSVTMKGKAKAIPSSSTEQDDAELDFFGLGSVTSSTPSTSSLKLSKPVPAHISSAPTPLSVPPSSTTTTDDPYPGFTQLPSGEWVAKDQATYDLWVASVAQQQRGDEVVAKEFAQASMQGKVVDLNEEQEKARKAWLERPEKVRQEWENKDEEVKDKAPLKAGQYRARQKGQLSALLADAVENRAELEERIARGKANRKAAGSRYGF